MNSYDIIENAIIDFWNKTYPQDVICFFYQKYDNETEWEWCEELAECDSCCNFSTIIFQNDFCEGQTDVKDITIVSLTEVLEYYTENHKLKDKSEEEE